MFRKHLLRFLYLFALLSLLGILSMAVSRLVTALYAISRTYNPQMAPAQPVAIVFGAGLRRDSTPTDVLRDRLNTAIDLYRSGKVTQLLMSGDHSSDNYNEPEAMRRYAIQQGIPAEDILLDSSGLRTYDTCHRARNVFGIRRAILVTQPFHLPRALYTCNQLGIQAIGVPAQNYLYRRASQTFWNVRESFATLVALWQVNISRPQPTRGVTVP